MYEDCVLVKLHWTKMRQAANKGIDLPLIKFPGSKLCPAEATKRMLRNARVCLPGGVAFVHADGLPWTYSQYNKKLQKFIAKIGLNPKDFASYSVSRGGTTAQFRARVPDKLIKIMCDWRLDCYLDYLQFPLESRALAQV